MELVEKAREIATKAHEGQVRKSDGSPYIHHPVAVAELLEEAGFNDEVVAAGLAHDVLEDTAVTEAELRSQLGEAVVDIVLGVSEDKTLEWEERKKQYIQTVINASEAVKAVSVADKIHNAQSFIGTYEDVGSDLWLKFSRGREKTLWFQRELCDELNKVWSHSLLDQYSELVNKMEDLD